MGCGLITAGIQLDCDNGLKPGAQPDIYLANFDDWDDATKGEAAGEFNTYESFNLPSGKSLFKIEGSKSSVEPLVEGRIGTYQNGFNHQVRIRVFKGTAAAKEQVKEILKGRFVAFVVNNYDGGGGDGKIEIYGDKVGMTARELTRTINDIDTGGAFDILLDLEDTIYEDNPPANYLNTDFATSKADLEAATGSSI